MSVTVLIAGLVIAAVFGVEVYLDVRAYRQHGRVVGLVLDAAFLLMVATSVLVWRLSS